MRKGYQIIFLCMALVLCLMSGCSVQENEQPNVQLTEEQEARIDLIVQHRSDWKEVKEIFASYPVNRVHIAESSDGITILTVAHVEVGTGSDKGWQTYIVHGFAANDSVFTSIDGYHQDWIADCVSVDLENMSDDELREVLRNSYKKYLAKNNNE